ncbi:MAG: inositol monophosphatase family protein [Cyanobacteria bacterium P01_E01_bin.6]
MSANPTPFEILTTLFPYLKAAAGYANKIQSAIAILPEKGDVDNPFAAALTDADLSIQTMIEVALLGNFPDIRFYGEEYEQSRNTKYFRSTELGPQDDYLITLDPIDGTRFYMDNHPNYQIILGILNADDFEAVIAVSPAHNIFDYALKGQGLMRGKLSDGLDSATPHRLEKTDQPILLGTHMGGFASHLKNRYRLIDVLQDYSKDSRIPNVNGLFFGELSGAVIRLGKFIDGGALAFLAREAGYIVSTLDGAMPPPLKDCTNYCLPGLVMAATPKMHHDILETASVVPYPKRT